MNRQFKTVPDTNILLASTSKNPESPNREYFERWLRRAEFDLLYSDDTLAEYALKLKSEKFGLPEEKIEELLTCIVMLGLHVDIEHFHLPVYPEDPDDVSFLLCAENGDASHLISYDHHILDLQYRHELDFKICELIDFLKELRASQATDR